MGKAKFRWKVKEAPTGPYKSFHCRGWPSAFYQNARQDICGDIVCIDGYTPFRARTGQHAPLSVRICDHSFKPFKWRTLKVTCKTLVEAKELLAAFIKAHPEWMPIEYRHGETT